MKITTVKEPSFRPIAEPILEPHYDDNGDVTEYRICFSRSVSLTQYAYHYVEVNTHEEAEAIADTMLSNGLEDLDWEDSGDYYGECDEEIEYVEEA